MKKKLAVLGTALVLIVTMVVTLCGCSSYGKIESAFKDDGWEIVSDVDALQNDLKDQIESVAGENYKDICDVHVFKKSVLGIPTYCSILEFKSDKDLTAKFEESYKALGMTDEQIKTAVEKIQELPNVNGNCVFVGVVGLDVFKGTK